MVILISGRIKEQIRINVTQNIQKGDSIYGWSVLTTNFLGVPCLLFAFLFWISRVIIELFSKEKVTQKITRLLFIFEGLFVMTASINYSLVITYAITFKLLHPVSVILQMIMIIIPMFHVFRDIE